MKTIHFKETVVNEEFLDYFFGEKDMKEMLENLRYLENSSADPEYSDNSPGQKWSKNNAYGNLLIQIGQLMKNSATILSQLGATDE